MTHHWENRLKDRDMVFDLLYSEKFLCTLYGLNSTEIVSENLRRLFMDILSEEHANQKALWNRAHTNGWYQVPQASPENIQAILDRAASQNQTQSPLDINELI